MSRTEDGGGSPNQRSAGPLPRIEGGGGSPKIVDMRPFEVCRNQNELNFI
jgi:hypothetical protein